MPWCPECKNEYVEGIKTCSDCKCDLVDDLEDETIHDQKLIFGDKDLLLELQAFLSYNKLPEGFIKEVVHEENVYELYMEPKYAEKAKQAIRIFLQEKALSEAEDTDESEFLGAKTPSYARAYEDKGEKATDVKASAQTLLFVGILGLIFLVLFQLGIIPISINDFTKNMMSIVLGGLFVIFIIMGIHSFRMVKKIMEIQKEETNLENEMKKWVLENLTSAAIDQVIFESEESYQEEIKFFMRFEEIKKRISNQFLNLEESFLDKFTEDMYVELYQNED